MKLAKLLAEASPRPWSAAQGHIHSVETEDRLAININCHWGNRDDAKHNARLIAALANSADALVELVRAARAVLTGGNHLAGLIGNHPPYGTDIDTVQKHYLPHHPDMYEAWCCWNTIMQLRDALAALGEEWQD